jgi:hypothetical protein
LAQALHENGRFDEALGIHREALSQGDVKRCQIAQAAITARHGNCYLEIGVDTGHNLRLISAPIKLAVDPIPAAPVVRAQVEGNLVQYFQMTSDQFFSENTERLAERPIDVAFIDGLHTYQQVLVDVENCLRFLSADGVILMHDCNPTTAEMAIPATSFEEACRLRKPGECTDWTGDVWKAVVHLRAARDDLTTFVLDCDYGVGVIVKRPCTDRLELGANTISNLTYADLEANRADYLGLRPPVCLCDVLDES